MLINSTESLPTRRMPYEAKISDTDIEPAITIKLRQFIINSYLRCMMLEDL